MTQSNEIDQTKAIITRLKSIASYLPGWSIGRTMCHGGNIVNSDGASVFIRLSGGRGGKGEASGSGPIDVDGQRMRLTSYGETNPEINFSVTKSDDRIAKDIAKRLLPRYLPLYAECLEQLKLNRKAKDYRRQTLDEIKSIFPNLDTDYDKQDISLYGLDLDLYGSIRINHDGNSGELKVSSVSKDLLLTLLKAIKEHAK